MRPTHFHSFVLLLSVLAACADGPAVDDAEDEGSSGPSTSSSGSTTGSSSGTTSEGDSGGSTTSSSTTGDGEEASTGEPSDDTSEPDSGSEEESGGPVTPGDCVDDLASADFGITAAGWVELGNDRQDPNQDPSATPGGARAKHARLLVTECAFLLLAENDKQWSGYRADLGSNFRRITENHVRGVDPHDVQVLDDHVVFVISNTDNQDYLYRMPVEGGDLVQVLGPEGTAEQIFDFHVRGDSTYLLGWSGSNQLYRVATSDLLADTLDRGEPIGMIGRSRTTFDDWSDDVLLVTSNPAQRLDLACVEAQDSLQGCLEGTMAHEFLRVDARVGDWVFRFEPNADVFQAHNTMTDERLESPLGLNYHGTVASHVHGDQVAVVVDGPDRSALYMVHVAGDELVVEEVDTTGAGTRMVDVWFNDAVVLVVSESSNSSGQIRLTGAPRPQ